MRRNKHAADSATKKQAAKTVLIDNDINQPSVVVLTLHNLELVNGRGMFWPAY